MTALCVYIYFMWPVCGQKYPKALCYKAVLRKIGTFLASKRWLERVSNVEVTTFMKVEKTSVFGQCGQDVASYLL